MHAFLNRIGGWWLHVWHSPTVRRVVKRLALLAVVVVSSPWLVAAWNIMLAGDRTQQGLLLVVVATGWTLWLIGRDIWRARREKRREHGQQERKTKGDAKTGAGTRRASKTTRRRRR